MNHHFYAVWVNYLPNSAVSNRMLAYFEAWSKMNVDVTAVFLLPDRNYSKLSVSYSNIHFQYMWDRFPFKARFIHYLLYDHYVCRFTKQLKSSDRVYVYGQANLLPKLLKIKGISVYHETTEHPLVVPLGVKLHKITIDRYLDCCVKLDGVFVISTQLKAFFIENGVAESNISIINMTVDPSRFSGIKKQNHSKKYIAYCGKASNNKDGVDQLIRAFAIVNKKYPDIYLYIIGKAPNPKDVNNNAVLVDNLGVTDRVVFTGVVSSADIPQMLTDAIVLALDRPDNVQSKYGFPTKLGEYLLTGNPVVVTRVGDIPLFIEDGISGMIAEPSNPEDFASKVIWIIEHPNEARIIGEKGKQIACINFNNETEARKIVDVILSSEQ